jgi:membrane fusion protein (multidrug efflux system)
MWIRIAKKFQIFTLLMLLMISVTLACNKADGESENSDASVTENGGDASGDTEAGSDKDGKEGEEDTEDDEDEAVPVEIATLDRGRIESILRFSTNLEAESEVQVFSEAARKVTQLLVEEGNVVRKGQVLIRLQSEAQQTELARVKSQLEKARQELTRQTSLFDQQLISIDDYNEVTYELEQLELTLNDAERELGYTQVRAPIAGTITERFVNIGDHVTVNQHLFDIIDFDSIVARIYVPEKELSRMRVGQDARIFAEAAGAEQRHGAVDRIAPRVDPRSGTLKVTVAIPPSEGLLPGMYVTVELITDVHDDAVLVPKKALVYDADQLFVFRLLADDTVERLLIRAALEDRDNIEPAGILEVGDRIVVAGQASLKEGSLVRLVGAASEAESAVESPE